MAAHGVDRRGGVIAARKHAYRSHHGALARVVSGEQAGLIEQQVSHIQQMQHTTLALEPAQRGYLLARHGQVERGAVEQPLAQQDRWVEPEILVV